MNKYQRIILAIMVCFSVFSAEARELNFPVPQTVSPEWQKLIAAQPASYWNTHPANIQEWEEVMFWEQVKQVCRKLF